MTIYVVTLADPATAECWAHGAYRTRAQAERVAERKRNADSYGWTVEVTTLRVRED